MLGNALHEPPRSPLPSISYEESTRASLRSLVVWSRAHVHYRSHEAAHDRYPCFEHCVCCPCRWWPCGCVERARRGRSFMADPAFIGDPAFVGDPAFMADPAFIDDPACLVLRHLLNDIPRPCDRHNFHQHHQQRARVFDCHVGSVRSSHLPVF